MHLNGNWQGISPGLVRRAIQILLDMRYLAEAPAAGMVSLSRKGYDSQTPKPVDSLYDYWCPVLLGASSNQKLLEACLNAETALARFRGQYTSEMTLSTDEREAMEKVAEVYAGRDPIEVARRLAGKVSPGWVEKARRANRRDPRTGERLEGWAGWSDEERRKRVTYATQQEWSIRQSAHAFGVSKTELHRSYGQYWRKESRPA